MIGNVLTLKQLEALIWVAELGSFRKAAHHLNTTQPNISTRIAGLEATLGVVLMQRDAGSIRLTDKGQEILQTARGVLRQAEQIVAISARPDLIEDRLRLGVTELVACTWLHVFLREIKGIYPALNVELTVDLSRNLDQEFLENQLDLVIQTAPFASHATGGVALGTFPYVWVAGAKIAKFLRGPQTVANLMEHSILTHARHTQAYVELAAHMTKHGLPISRLIASNSMASCVQMAADNMGVSMLPRSLVASQIADQSLQEIEVDWTPSSLRFAARYHAEKAPLFVEHAAELAAIVVVRTDNS